MKRAKLVLALVATLAVAGGAFAVKASKFTGTRFYTTTVKGDVPASSELGFIDPTGTYLYYTTVQGDAANNYAKILQDN